LCSDRISTGASGLGLDVSVVPGLCGIDLLDEVDGIGKGLGRSLSSLGVVGLHADGQLLSCERRGWLTS
jgi:hypothetical protein